MQNRLTKTTDALGNMNSMSYDAVGNKLTDTDANSHTTNYQYDALNRLIRRTDAEGDVTQMLYDMVGLAVARNAPARPRARASSPSRSTRRASHLLSTTASTANPSKPQANRYCGRHRRRRRRDPNSYDAQSNRLTCRPNGNTTSYAYDALNRQVKVTNAAGDVTHVL